MDSVYLEEKLGKALWDEGQGGTQYLGGCTRTTGALTLPPALQGEDEHLGPGSEVPRTELVSCAVNCGHCPQLAPPKSWRAPDLGEKGHAPC